MKRFEKLCPIFVLQQYVCSNVLNSNVKNFELLLEKLRTIKRLCREIAKNIVDVGHRSYSTDKVTVSYCRYAYPKKQPYTELTSPKSNKCPNVIHPNEFNSPAKLTTLHFGANRKLSATNHSLSKITADITARRQNS